MTNTANFDFNVFELMLFPWSIGLFCFELLCFNWMPHAIICWVRHTATNNYYLPIGINFIDSRYLCVYSELLAHSTIFNLFWICRRFSIVLIDGENVKFWDTNWLNGCKLVLQLYGKDFFTWIFAISSINMKIPVVKQHKWC